MSSCAPLPISPPMAQVFAGGYEPPVVPRWGSVVVNTDVRTMLDEQPMKPLVFPKSLPILKSSNRVLG